MASDILDEAIFDPSRLTSLLLRHREAVSDGLARSESPFSQLVNFDSYQSIRILVDQEIDGALDQVDSESGWSALHR